MADFEFHELTRRFDECTGMPPEECERYLQKLAEANPALAAELRALVDAHADPTFLNQPPRLPVSERPEPALPERIGKYRIQAELGRGGMGVVYLGLHEGDGFVREVAIKVIKRGLDTDEIVQRFKRERRILGQLAHEQIAGLVDGGATPEGLPYLVMERVQGERIDRWCERKKLGVEARVRLFRKVCDAVSYAHRQSVIHRDLKPGNILVTEEGVPKLLDFGVAKLLAGDDPEATATVYAPHTPEYASPEQIAGGAVSTLTDLYSLGVILYELLTGRRPRPGLAEPPLVEKDLDRVVLKALRSDPNERYKTVEQFSEDLERWLRNEPILARPATTAYRARKFVMRHKRSVAAAAILGISLAATTGWAVQQTRIAREARLRADRRFRETRGIGNALLFQIYDQVRHLPGAMPVSETIVHEALHYLDSLAADVGDDLDLRYELASGYRRLASLQGEPMLANKGDTAGAFASLQKAIRLQESIVKVSQYPPARLFLATLYDDRSRLYSQSGKKEECRADAARSLGLTEQVVAEAPTQYNRMELATGLLHSSAHYMTPDVVATGIAQLERAVALFDRLAQDGLSSEPFRIQRAFAHKRLGAVTAELRHDRSSARRHYQEALAIDEALVNEHPERADLRYDLTYTLGDLSYMDMTDGRLESALAGLLRVLGMREALAGSDPKDVQAQSGIANTCRNISEALHRQKQFAQAVPYVMRAAAIEERLAGSSAAPSERLARTYWEVGAHYLVWAKAEQRDAAGHLELADRYYRKALPVYVQLEKSGQLGVNFKHPAQDLNQALAEIATLQHKRTKTDTAAANR